MHKFNRVLLLTLAIVTALVASGCDAEPTPLPLDAFIVTEATPTPDAVTLSQRVALTAPFAALYSDWSLVYPADSTILDDDPQSAADFDLVVGVGTPPESAEVAGTLIVGLVANRTRAPLDDETLSSVILRVPAPNALTFDTWMITPSTRESLPAAEVRAGLANAGFPDGVTLVLARPEAITFEALEQQFNNANVRLLTIEYALDRASDVVASGNAHLVLTSWLEAERLEWEERVGSENLLPLFTVPIYYFPGPERTVELDSNGLPILTG